MSITRMNMQRLADGIKYVADDPTTDHATVVKVVQEISNALHSINPNFKRERFVAAVFGEGQQVTNIYSGGKIDCGACGYDRFYDKGRSLDYFNWECARCGHKCSTLTETGASR